MVGLIDISTQTAAIAGVTILSLAYAFYQYFVQPLYYFQKLNIPGPKPSLFVGTAFNKETGGHLGQIHCIKKYGKVYGGLLGVRPIMVIADPEMLKEVLVKQFSNFPNRYAVIPPAPEFSRNLLAIKDDDWKRIRNVLIPTFSATKLKQIEPIIIDACDTLVGKIIKENRENGKVNIWKLCGEYSMEVIMAAAFGVHVTDKVRGQKICKAAAAFFGGSDVALLIASVVPSLYPFLSFLARERTNAVNHTVQVARAVIAERRRNLQNGLTNRRDLLQLMIEAAENGKLTDDEIVSQSFIFLLAGYETTSNALGYTSYLLALNPQAQQRLIDEIDEKCPKGTNPTIELLSELPYLDMVFNESLRIYPPAYIVNRATKHETVIKGVKIPQGLIVAIPIYGIHHNDELWPDPEKFIPERFTPEEKAKRHPFAYLPFGNGPRNCIGMRLAITEAKLALIKILQNVVLEPVKETPIPLEVEPKLTLSVANGVIIGVKER
ncbi:uncharacterized protein TRIADDRAFT_54379 [Trichoplax adhaerens]|uniref:Cytochrome P450 n=1 Tax=Trichoplax adhaerens TaxID=10228 RepID=B3RRV3_TRIAD|nr:hypothetical protein TRIADDRAFT_54379 [Trichoplax adhaerens]EDV26414.1 hypothetical protein TRIADDRAFT_54379 [Trichoplax adhaerens]|eukprot:XP_002110410.1 hypothetical protein TRIADDRAFT_54379 [Trichoplax adhaerens]